MTEKIEKICEWKELPSFYYRDVSYDLGFTTQKNPNNCYNCDGKNTKCNDYFIIVSKEPSK